MPASSSPPQPVVMLIEDNPGDAELIQEALEEIDADCTLKIATTGNAAIDELKAASDRPEDLPDLILLDLNLPGKDGREVLTEIKSDPALATIPVIILTSSDAVEDINQAYELHANCYIRKPLDFERLVDVIRTTHLFWLELVQLPRRT